MIYEKGGYSKSGPGVKKNIDGAVPNGTILGIGGVGSILPTSNNFLLTLSIVESYVTNFNKDQVVVVFTRPVTIDGLTGISLDFEIGNIKTINSFSGSGTDTLIFTLNTDVEYGDQFSVNFSGSNVQDSNSNNIGTVGTTVDATDVDQVYITDKANLYHWFTSEDNSLVFNQSGVYASDSDLVQENYDKSNTLGKKLGQFTTIDQPSYDASRKAIHLTNSIFLQTVAHEFDGGAGGGSIFFQQYSGDFHDFWKLEVVGTNNLMAGATTGANRGWEINGSTGNVRIWTTQNTAARSFPSVSTKISDGAVIILELVRYNSNTIECFVTDSEGRESLGTLIDTGMWPDGQTINNRVNIAFGEFYFYQMRSYGANELANYLDIDTEMNF